MMQMDIFASVPGYKKCACCGRYKAVGEYNISKASNDGLQGYCKACQKMYRIKHPNKEYKNNKRDNYSLEIWQK